MLAAGTCKGHGRPGIPVPHTLQYEVVPASHSPLFRHARRRRGASESSAPQETGQCRTGRIHPPSGRSGGRVCPAGQTRKATDWSGRGYTLKLRCPSHNAVSRRDILSTGACGPSRQRPRRAVPASEGRKTADQVPEKQFSECAHGRRGVVADRQRLPTAARSTNEVDVSEEPHTRQWPTCGYSWVTPCSSSVS